MSTSKHINQICVAVTAVMLILAILLMTTGNFGISYADTVMGYEDRLFRTDTVHTIDIVINDWESFLETCENEEYSVCTVLIDGEKHSNVGIRAKGNTSLSSVKSMGSQRYSFKLEFDQYESGKSYHGLDKLCLNNLIQDNTMMKDYLVYQMMSEFGVDAPLCSYVYITVNGEDWGLYLAVEGIEDAFLRRNYGSDVGELYKPDTMSNGGGRGNGKDFSMSDFDFDDMDFSSEDFMNTMPQMPSDNAQSEEMPQMPSDNAQSEEMPQTPTDNAQSEEMPQMPSGDFSGFQGGAMPSQGGFSGMPSGDFQNGEMPQIPSGDFQNGEMPQIPSGDFQNGEIPQMPSGDFQSGEIPQMPSGDAQSEEMPAQNDAEQSDAGQKDSEQSIGNRFGWGNFGDIDFSDIDFSNMNLGGGGFGGMGSSDVKLQYIDDDAESYSNIFNNAKTDVSEQDQNRLIAALKNLSEYSDLENTLDMEEVLRYFVVHNFVCNSDSYTGMMIHNYYLHEKDGQLSMIPWDYNLAYGTMMGSNASSTVNASIDSPVSNGSVDDRPMVGWIFSDETYTEMYHTLFSEFIGEWFASGKMARMIADTNELIRPYVEKDPTKFCALEEYDAGVSAISEFMTLRAEAVTRQLDGDTTKVNTGSLNISAMGTMNNTMGGGMGGDMDRNADFDFDVSSMFTVTDRDGNAVELSSIIHADSLASISFADGTTVQLNDADMRNLMQMDFANIVSATDKDGNVIDLSEYTISMKSFDSSATRRGRTKETVTNTPSAENMPNAENTSSAEKGEEAQPSSDSGDRPSVSRTQSGYSQEEDNTLLLCIVSIAALAAGLFIAIKKK